MGKKVPAPAKARGTAKRRNNHGGGKSGAAGPLRGLPPRLAAKALRMEHVVPWKPVRPAVINDRLQAGPGLLAHQAKLALRRCSGAELAGLKELLLQSGPVADSLGTFCSGTDSPVTAELAAWEAFREVLGLDVEGHPRHVFSVEISPAKREFIKQVCPDLKHLYSNVLDMCNESVHNNVNDKSEKPARSRRLAAGFPCKDFIFVQN